MNINQTTAALIAKIEADEYFNAADMKALCVVCFGTDYLWKTRLAEALNMASTAQINKWCNLANSSQIKRVFECEHEAGMPPDRAVMLMGRHGVFDYVFSATAGEDSEWKPPTIRVFTTPAQFIAACVAEFIWGTVDNTGWTAEKHQTEYAEDVAGECGGTFTIIRARDGQKMTFKGNTITPIDEETDND